jgi:hypothetical protein
MLLAEEWLILPTDRGLIDNVFVFEIVVLLAEEWLILPTDRGLIDNVFVFEIVVLLAEEWLILPTDRGLIDKHRFIVCKTSSHCWKYDCAFGSVVLSSRLR